MTQHEYISTQKLKSKFGTQQQQRIKLPIVAMGQIKSSACILALFIVGSVYLFVDLCYEFWFELFFHVRYEHYLCPIFFSFFFITF